VSSADRTDGFGLVDKPPEWTSFDAVRWVRKAMRGAKVGHSGTLDPFATGLLILLVGRATRLMQYLDEYRKTYVGHMRLGQQTDTCDPSGEVVSEAAPGAVEALTTERIQAAFDRWVGEVEQVPPRFSAVKIGGEPAYKKARRGEEPDLEPRGVEIHRLTVSSFDPPDVAFEAEVGTGTYVRALARDIGSDLEVGGHLLDLRRTRIGPFAVEDAFPLQHPEGEGYFREWLRPMSELLPRAMKVEVTAAQARRITHGNDLRLPAEAVRHAEEYSFVGAVCREELVAMGRLVVVGDDGLFQPRTVLSDPAGYGGAGS
jgi:tRNA pseudouridine55 synthase